MVFTIECSNHSNIIIGGCSSIGRTTVCGTVSFLFKSEYPPVIISLLIIFTNFKCCFFKTGQIYTIFKNSDKNFTFCKLSEIGDYIISAMDSFLGFVYCELLEMSYYIMAAMDPFSIYDIFISIISLCGMIRLIGVKKLIFLGFYLFHMYSFVESNNMGFFMVSIIAILSIMTLLLFLASTNRDEKSISDYINRWKSMPDNSFLVVILALSITFIFRNSLLYCLPLGQMGYSSISLLRFDLIVPNVIVFKLACRTISRRFSVRDSDLFISLLIELKNTDNFRLNNLTINYFTIFFIMVLPLVDPLLLAGYIMLIMRDTGEIWKHSGIISSCTDLSYPPNNFENPVTLNEEVSKTLDFLKEAGAVGQPVESGGDILYDISLTLNDEPWFMVDTDVYYRASYLKSQFTRSIESFYAEEIVFDKPFSMDIRGSYINNRGIINKFNNIRTYPKHEDKVDALINTMLPHFFGSDRGYAFNAQFKDSNVNRENVGKIDCVVDFDNTSVLIIENKADAKSTGSWLDVIQQAQRYAKNNDDFTSVFVMVFRGTKMSCFIYDEDFHSDMNFYLKYPVYQDLIGLQVTRDGIRLVPQCNTFHPQFKIYDTGPNAKPSDILATTVLFKYISNFRIVEGVNCENGNFSIRTPEEVFKKIKPIEVASYQLGLGNKLKLDAFGEFKVPKNPLLNWLIIGNRRNH